MFLKRIFSFYVTFLSIVCVTCPSYSGFQEAHQHENSEDKTKVTSLSVSARCRTFFSQPTYTYSFPFVDENDLKILKTLSKIFREETHSSVTQGTYSIAIDYDPSSQSDKIYQQTRYLVEKDQLTPGIINCTKDFGKSCKTIKCDGYQLFQSHGPHAPRFYKSSGGNYHMENALMSSLEEDRDKLLKDILEDIPESSRILGVCIKLYQSKDCCSDCRSNILKNIPRFQEMFDEAIRGTQRFELDKQPIPFMVTGLMVRHGGNSCHCTGEDAQCKMLEAGYWTALFSEMEHCSFDGKINGNIPQEMMPVYIHMQKSREINSKKVIVLEQENCL